MAQLVFDHSGEEVELPITLPLPKLVRKQVFPLLVQKGFAERVSLKSKRKREFIPSYKRRSRFFRRRNVP